MSSACAPTSSVCRGWSTSASRAAKRRCAPSAGLGPKRTERITRAWAEQKAIKEVMFFLRGVGVSTSLAVKVAPAGSAIAEAAAPLTAVYLPPFYHSERSLAAALRQLLSPGADRLASFRSVDWAKAFGWLRGRTGTDLAPEQADAVKLALTGSPPHHVVAP